MQISDGFLHPALHGLEQEGWTTPEWKPSENNLRANLSRQNDATAKIRLIDSKGRLMGHSLHSQSRAVSLQCLARLTCHKTSCAGRKHYRGCRGHILRTSSQLVRVYGTVLIVWRQVRPRWEPSPLNL
jgi:hypothetical protein